MNPFFALCSSRAALVTHSHKHRDLQHTQVQAPVPAKMGHVQAKIVLLKS